MTAEKTPWHGRITSVQPSIRLLRSFDQRQHSYQGYVLALSGTLDGAEADFSFAVCPSAHARHALQAGMELSGQAVPVADPRLETARYYKVIGLILPVLTRVWMRKE